MASKKKRYDWRYTATTNVDNSRASLDMTIKDAREKLSKIPRGIADLRGKSTLANAISRPISKNKLFPHEIDLARRIIIGDHDDRKPVSTNNSPFNSICLLLITDQLDNSYQGTGFLATNRCILTAGHNLFFNGDWIKKVTVSPGADGPANSPFGSVVGAVFQSVAGWTAQGDANFDFGAILLDKDQAFQHIDNFLVPEVDNNRDDIFISGYGLDKNESQTQAAGKVSNRQEHQLFYDVDTVEGNSGSPIFFDDGTQKTCIGIHTQGGEPNFGIRIKPKTLSQIEAWMNH